MLRAELVKLFITEGMLSSLMFQNVYTPGNPPHSPIGGLNLVRMITTQGEIEFNVRDLYEYERNKEFYNSKLYKHLAGYNDEET